MPPPSVSDVLPVMMLPRTCAAGAPAKRMPPPVPPLHSGIVLLEIVLLRIVAFENCTVMPPPRQPALPVTTLFSTMGDPPEM
jgi:hypothetical protein